MTKLERGLLYALDMLTILGTLLGFYLAWGALRTGADGGGIAMASLAIMAIACAVLPLSLSIIAHLSISRSHWPKR